MRPIDADELEKSLENYSNNHGLINAFVEFLNVMDGVSTLDVVSIPKDATNGDVLTAIFGAVDTDIGAFNEHRIQFDKHNIFYAEDKWLNAPYRKKKK